MRSCTRLRGRGGVGSKFMAVKSYKCFSMIAVGEMEVVLVVVVYGAHKRS